MELRISRAARRAGIALFMLAAVAGSAAAADPQPWPQRPIRIIAAQQAGSATDNVARLVADALEKELGVAVTVDNRPGAGGKIGAEAAARATADGYTLLVGGTSNLVIPPATESDLRYDPAKDFVAIGRVAHVPFGFVVHTGVPARNLRELADLARAKPGKLTYATLGPATSTGFGMAMFLHEAKADMLAIEYRGISSALPDVLSGRVDALFNEVALLSQHGQEGGSLRILAIASPRRSPKLPNVPTTAEQGYPRVVIAPWYGILAPADTPAAVVKRLNEAYQALVRSPVVRSRIDALGYEPLDDSAGQFASALREDIATIRSLAGGPATASSR